jgi:hypothetical protein
LLRRVPQAIDIEVGALPWPARVPGTRGGAGVGRVGQADDSGGAPGALGVARRTLQRWRRWWREQFPLTPLWRAACARFMPPVPTEELPGELLERFTGAAHEALTRLLVWLSPVTADGQTPAAIELREGC